MIAKLKSLKNHQGFMKYFKNTSWLFVEKILRMVVGLFVGIWVARYLGPEQFGLFSYALAFTSMFGFFVTLGMDGGYVVKELKSDKNTQEVLATSLFLKFIGSIFAITLIAIIIRIIEDDVLTISLVTVAAFTYIFKVFSVFDLYFQSKVLSKYVVYSNLIALLIASTFRIYLILSNSSLELFVYVAVLEIAIASLFFIIFYMKYSDGFHKFNINIKYAKNILQNTWPIMISAFLISIYMQIDIVMIKNMLGDTEAGNYAAATKISALFYFIPVAITSSLYPAILNAKKDSESLYYNRFAKLFDFSVYLMLPVSLFITYFASEIITLLYTDTYSMAASVLMIHIWAVLFVFFNNIQWKWYIIENLQSISFKITLMATVLNVLLNLYLIPLYGVNGAAISTLISFSFASFLGNILFQKTKNIFYMQLKALVFFTIFKKFFQTLNKIKFYILHNKYIGDIFQPGRVFLGDSHTMVFEYMIDHKILTNWNNLVVKVPGASCQGAVNPKSKTNAFNIYKKYLCKMSKNNEIIIMLGEVDCGFVIWYRSEKYNESLEFQLKNSLEKYEEFILFILNSGFKNISVCASIYPTIKDGITKGNVVDERKAIQNTRKERQNLTIKFNDKLKKLANKHNCRFLDINQYILDKQTGFIDDEFLNDDLEDHHLDSNKIYKFWLKELKN